MLDLLLLAAIAALAAVAFLQTRDFVRRRLTYVDAAQTLRAPIIAGVVTALVALPVTWILPFVGGGTALLMGAAVGAGVVAGQRDVRKRLSGGGA